MTVGKPQLLFSIKLFIAAMLAYAIAESIGLQNPYWAMVTCCVLNNPISSAIRARGTYRFCGTLFAGVLALGMASFLSNTPVLFAIVLGIISALMMGCSFLDRTPKAYFFQLGAVTVLLVGIVGISHPETLFTTVVSRVSEICLGIVSVTMVDSVLFPSSLMPVLQKRLEGWLSDLQCWHEDSFAGKVSDSEAKWDRIRLLSDIASFNQIMTTLNYDRSVDKSTRQAAIAIQQRILQIVPLLSSIGNSVASLPESLRLALTDWLNAVRQESRDETPQYHDFTALLPAAGQLSPWEKLIVDELQEQVSCWTLLWAEVRQLHRFLDGGTLSEELYKSMMRSKVFSPPADTGIAVRMFAGILTTYTLLCVLWYLTGWEQGANMIVMGVVAIGFFGSADNPAASLASFGRFTLFAMVFGAILSFVLFPLANDYISFLIIMGVFLLPLGVWSASNPQVTLAVALALSNVSFQGHYTQINMGLFMEGTAASLIGVYGAFICSSLYRRWGSDQAAARLIRKDARAMLALNRYISNQDLSYYQASAIDRIAVLGTRLRDIDRQDSATKLLTRLTTAINLIRMHQVFEKVPNHPPIIELLTEFRQLPLIADTPPELLSKLDAGLQFAWHQDNNALLRPLTRLRLLHFPTAMQWNP
jgi:uncharacterized membrane protein YccC